MKIGDTCGHGHLITLPGELYWTTSRGKPQANCLRCMRAACERRAAARRAARLAFGARCQHVDDSGRKCRRFKNVSGYCCAHQPKTEEVHRG